MERFSEPDISWVAPLSLAAKQRKVTLMFGKAYSAPKRLFKEGPATIWVTTSPLIRNNSLGDGQEAFV